MMKNENEYKANSVKRGEKGFHAKEKKEHFQNLVAECRLDHVRN